jgi:hypothetical protein
MGMAHIMRNLAGKKYSETDHHAHVQTVRNTWTSPLERAMIRFMISPEAAALLRKIYVESFHR